MKEGCIEWFGGNQDALNLFRLFVTVAHTWDDLIDRDKPVSDDAINLCFRYALVDIPTNPAYQANLHALHPLLISAIACYRTANHYEQTNDMHGLELAHTLRYAVANVFVYLITTYAGEDAANKYLPEALKQMMNERLFVYLKEHSYQPFMAENTSKENKL